MRRDGVPEHPPHPVFASDARTIPVQWMPANEPFWWQRLQVRRVGMLDVMPQTHALSVSSFTDMEAFHVLRTAGIHIFDDAFHHVLHVLPRAMLAHSPLSFPPWICDGIRSAMSRISISALLVTEPAPHASSSTVDKSSASPLIERHGRLYHRRLLDTYPFPCDEAEQERWDALHHAFYNVALEDELHISVLPKRPLRVLDIGCGTGIWAISMAEKYPDAEVVAVDVGDHHPKQHDVDFGVKFVSGIDFTSEEWLAAGEGSFDFIHLGLLCGSVPDWTSLYRKAYRLLRPGGHVESIEFDWTPLHPTFLDHNVADMAVLQHWWQSLSMAMANAGRPLAYPSSMEDHILAAGLRTSQHMTMNINTAEDMRLHQDDRHNSLARWHRYTTFHSQFNTIHALSMEPLTRYRGFPEEQASSLCTAVSRLLNRPDSPFFHRLHVVSARRDD